MTADQEPKLSWAAALLSLVVRPSSHGASPARSAPARYPVAARAAPARPEAASREPVAGLLGDWRFRLAETFWCNGEPVKFSNGAVEILLAHWLALAESRSGQPGAAALATFLRHRLEAVGFGWRAFGMDRDKFPAELSAPECLAALAGLIEETAHDASQIRGIDWDANLRDWWESRLWELHRALQAW
jgi:hypothetical protein